MEDEKENIYSTPKSDLIDSGNVETETQFLPLSTTKFFIMNIMSFGIYSLYWFYKNWSLQKPLIDRKIYPIWRALFSIFFVHALFKRVEKACEIKGIEKNWSVNVLATVYIVVNIIDAILNYFSELFMTDGTAFFLSISALFITLWVLYEAQKTINLLNNDPKGALNSSITLANMVVILLGLFIWAINIVVLMVPDFLTQ